MWKIKKGFLTVHARYVQRLLSLMAFYGVVSRPLTDLTRSRLLWNRCNF